jgi:hypothetical protein
LKPGEFLIDEVNNEDPHHEGDGSYLFLQRERKKEQPTLHKAGSTVLKILRRAL